MTSLSSNASSPAQPSYVTEVTARNFMQEVVQSSLQMPVLVYFTAAWCGPCKQYGPLLEKLVNGAKGQLRLARVDIDKNPDLAQQFRIQSVPMVFIFFQGQPLDALAGVMQESQLKQALAQFLTPSSGEEAVQATLEEAAALLASGQVAQAEQAYKMILAQEETNNEAIAGLAKCFIAEGHHAKAEQLLAEVSQEAQTHEAIVAAKAALAIAKSVPAAANEKTLRETLAANALDHQARYNLAAILFASGRQEEAISELLTIITKNKEWNEGEARRQLLAFFEALGLTHPLSMQGRRKLSSLLFS